MDDMERYGDYNEIADSPSGEKNKVLLGIKAVALVLVFSVVGLLAFRLILFNYYPSAMKKIYFNDVLSEFYELTEEDGQIGAKTQTLKAPYDDAKEANFMADHLIFIPGASQLQISLRFNRNLYARIGEKINEGKDGEEASYGELSSDIFSFRLRKEEFGEGGAVKYTDAPSVCEWETVIMYDYCKLVFDGVDFSDGGEGYWTVLEIYVDGMNGEKPFSEILVLDGKEEFYHIKDYKLSKGERP